MIFIYGSLVAMAFFNLDAYINSTTSRFYASTSTKIEQALMWLGIDLAYVYVCYKYFCIESDEEKQFFYQELDKMIFFSDYHIYFLSVYYLKLLLNINQYSGYTRKENCFYVLGVQILYFFQGLVKQSGIMICCWIFAEALLIASVRICYHGSKIFSVLIISSVLGIGMTTVEVDMFWYWHTLIEFAAACFVVVSITYFYVVGVVVIMEKSIFLMRFIELKDFLYKRRKFNSILHRGIIDFLSVLVVLVIPTMSHIYEVMMVEARGHFHFLYEFLCLLSNAYPLGYFLTFFNKTGAKNELYLNYFSMLFVEILFKYSIKY